MPKSERKNARTSYALNSGARRATSSDGLFSSQDLARVSAYFRASPQFAPTPLRRLPGLAGKLGLGELSIKDESHRLVCPLSRYSEFLTPWTG